MFKIKKNNKDKIYVQSTSFIFLAKAKSLATPLNFLIESYSYIVTIQCHWIIFCTILPNNFQSRLCKNLMECQLFFFWKTFSYRKILVTDTKLLQQHYALVNWNPHPSKPGTDRGIWQRLWSNHGKTSSPWGKYWDRIPLPLGTNWQGIK